MRQVSRAVATAAIGLVAFAGSLAAQAEIRVTGAGATFPYPIYSKWFDAYAQVDPSVRFNYQSIGSGGGQKQILAETVDFGASDGPMSDANLAKAPRKSARLCVSAASAVLISTRPVSSSRRPMRTVRLGLVWRMIASTSRVRCRTVSGVPSIMT